MPNKSNNQTRDSLVVTAFQTACLAIIVLIAKLIGDLLYNAFLSEGFSTQLLPILSLLIFVSVLDFIELTNNWASIKKYFKQYNGWLFMIDVITLGGFFWQVYCLSKLIDDHPAFIKLTENEFEQLEQFEQRVKGIIIISYICIFLLYFLWNLFLKDKDKLKMDDRKNIIFFTKVRLAQMILLIIFLLFMEIIPICGIIIYVLFCIACTIKHNQKLNIFETIIDLQ